MRELKKKIVSRWLLPAHSLAEVTKIFLPMKGSKASVDGSEWGEVATQITADSNRREIGQGQAPCCSHLF